jgi:hypothetical protein
MGREQPTTELEANLWLDEHLPLQFERTLTTPEGWTTIAKEQFTQVLTEFANRKLSQSSGAGAAVSDSARQKKETPGFDNWRAHSLPSGFCQIYSDLSSSAETTASVGR